MPQRKKGFTLSESDGSDLLTLLPVCFFFFLPSPKENTNAVGPGGIAKREESDFSVHVFLYSSFHSTLNT